MARVLGVHVINDAPTRYASYWVQLILEEFRRAGHVVSELTGAAVTTQGLRSAVEEWAPDAVVFGGHGLQNLFTGVGVKPILVACNNDAMLAGRSCLFVSCLTGVTLCPSIVSKGGVAAQGFIREYMWMTDGGSYPAGDPYAESFTRTLVEAARVVARGGSWQGWMDAFRRVSREEIARWNGSSDPVAASVVFCLESNMDAAVVAGGGVIEGDSMDTVPEGADLGSLIPLGLGLLLLAG